MARGAIRVSIAPSALLEPAVCSLHCVCVCCVDVGVDMGTGSMAEPRVSREDEDEDARLSVTTHGGDQAQDQ